MYTRMSSRTWRAGLAGCLAWALALAGRRAAADEGMWPFNAPPVDRIARDHGVRITAGWLDHLQRSSVRFNTGGSGAFVSATGLVLTNHHVGADAIHKLGDAEHDYLRDGFAAPTAAAELQCHDLELNVLVSIEDVTARVRRAVPEEATPDEAFEARRAVLAEIERESLAATGLRSDVVALYQGGAYHLHRSKRYTDVRLVFAPEQQIAFYGGDPDNFEFPRYDLDVCFFRAYEDGRPARVDRHLVWADVGVREGDTVFVSGHPGHTDRGATIAELVSLRDRRLPLDLRLLTRREAVIRAYALRGPEEKRQATQDLRGVENGRKARGGVLAGLLDPRIMETRRRAEAELRQGFGEPSGPAAPFARIERAQAALDATLERERLLEGGAAFDSEYFRNARTILRAVTERAKPSGQRLREYRDSNRGPLELRLFSEKPIHDAFEIVKLTDSLTLLATSLGGDDPLVTAVLAGRSPADRAATLVAGTELGRRAGMPTRPDRRRELYDGGEEAVNASSDPMLGLARLVDAEARRLRALAESADEEQKQAHAEIVRARHAREGAAMYPDATFTLRLAVGSVRGVRAEGRECGAITTFGGLFARAVEKQNVPPFDLPPRWRAAGEALRGDAEFMATPLNFASTADIIGGNSGSPVVNAAGQLVGVIFDGNIHSLVLDVAYDDVLARAVAVDARGIRAALSRVYGARWLLDELAAAGERSGALDSEP